MAENLKVKIPKGFGVMWRFLLIPLFVWACSADKSVPVAPAGKTACPMCGLLGSMVEGEDSTVEDTTAVAPEDTVAVDTPADLPDSLSFNIELVYLNDDLTEEDIALVEEMASLWEQVIIGDLPDYELEHELFWDFEQDGRVVAEKGQIIDDIRIYVATLPPQEGAYGATLWERWEGELFKGDPGLPAIGAIWIKSLTTLREIGYPHVEQETRRVIAHEMGHALGIGTTPRWNALVKQKDGQYYFDGPQAIEAWNAAGGASYEGNKVPFGDAGGHWDDLLFNDIMVNGAFDIRISSVTVAALADIGYEVGPSPTLDVRVGPSFEEKLEAWGEIADERHNWIACFHHGDCPSSETSTTPSPNLVEWEDWESASEFLLTCPTPDEVAEIDRDINITFANDPTANWPPACTAEEGSVNLSVWQMGAYQSLRFMKTVEFEEPIPWTDVSLYDWFIALPDTIRFDGNEEYSYAASQRIVISGFIELDEAGELRRAPTWLWNYRYDRSLMGEAAISLIQLLVHEARHVEGPGHTCDGGGDKTFTEMGAWAYAYYTLAWFTHKTVPKGLLSHRERLGLRWQINDLCSTRICEEGCPPIKGGLRGGGSTDDT